jgi:predicted MFS family arabinose efflux permease
MFKAIIDLYRQSYSGLSRAAWMLALVMLINRSGAMVMPFLGVYLRTDLGFTLDQVGICLSAYGAGSILGGFLGGYLTDRIGHFKVQLFSLLAGGALFGVLAFIEGYYLLLVSLFLASVIIECLRPANTSSIALYARPENLTRAFSLNRMAINLGFSIGPALGGVLASYSFKLIFAADALTCVAAGLVFYFYFRRIKVQPRKKPTPGEESVNPGNAISPWKNRQYLMFIVLTSLFGILFFQLFTALPLYYKESCHYSSTLIGALLALNGLIVFIFEMIFVYKVGKRSRYKTLIAAGLLLCGLAFAILILPSHFALIVISMVMLSFGEILAMPFIASVAAESAPDRYRGAYMGLFTVAYSVSFAVAPLVGTRLIQYSGFDGLWYFLLIFSVFIGIGFYMLVPKMKTALIASQAPL